MVHKHAITFGLRMLRCAASTRDISHVTGTGRRLLKTQKRIRDFRLRFLLYFLYYERCIRRTPLSRCGGAPMVAAL